MSTAENTRMKGLEADLKKLFQLLEESKEEQRAERARVTESAKLKIDVIQNFIAQLLENKQHGSTSNTAYEHHHRPPQPFRRIQFDLPKFDGQDALNWIFALDQYFDFYRIPEEEQMSIAAIHMIGMAIPWFQTSQRTTQFRSWNQLKRAVELEFGSSLFKSPRELLFKLSQNGSVAEYYTKFVTLANWTNIDPHDALKDYLISGSVRTLEGKLRLNVLLL